MSKGERIKLLRKAKNLSQDELAGLLNISKQAVGKYEKNIVTNIPSDKIEALARILDSTPEFILGWKPITEATPEEQAELDAMLTNDPELMRLMKKIAKLDAKGRKAVTQLVDTLTE